MKATARPSPPASKNQLELELKVEPTAFPTSVDIANAPERAAGVRVTPENIEEKEREARFLPLSLKM